MLAFGRGTRALAIIGCAWSLVSGCGTSDDYKDKLLGESWSPDSGTMVPSEPTGTDGGVEPDASMAAPKCVPASTSEPLPAREAVMSTGDTANATPGVFTEDLFGRFVNHCGSCHANLASQGGLSVNAGTIAMRIGPEALERIRSDMPDHVMPPPPIGKPFSERAATPVRCFASLLEQMDRAPAGGGFYQPPQPTIRASPYKLSRRSACSDHPRQLRARVEHDRPDPTRPRTRRRVRRNGEQRRPSKT